MSADAAIEAVRNIHLPIDALMYGIHNSWQTRVCTGCGQDDGNWQTWPCPTIRAINEATE